MTADAARSPTTADQPRPAVDTPMLGVFFCARCGQDHGAHSITWRAFDRPIGPCNFWAPCPVTGDPILLMVHPDDPVLPCP